MWDNLACLRVMKVNRYLLEREDRTFLDIQEPCVFPQTFEDGMCSPCPMCELRKGSRLFTYISTVQSIIQAYGLCYFRLHF